MKGAVEPPECEARYPVMPHYFFHIHNSTGHAEDDEGQDLADDEAARVEALKGIRSLLAEEVLKGGLDLRGRIDIVDDAARVVAVIAFSEALNIRFDEDKPLNGNVP